MANNESPDIDSSSNSHYRPVISAETTPVEEMPIVELASSELDSLSIAAERFVTDGGCSSRKATLNGLGGEKAWAKYVSDALPHRVQPDTDTRESGDRGIDFEIQDATYQIKTAKRETREPELQVGVGKTQADVYVLVNRLANTTFRLVGHTPREVVEDSPVSSSRYGDYHRVDRSKLIPFPPRLNSPY